MGDENLPRGQLFRRGHHHLEEGPEAVVDVHHRQAAVRLQVAGVATGFQRVVEDLDGVVWGQNDTAFTSYSIIILTSESGGMAAFCDGACWVGKDFTSFAA